MHILCYCHQLKMWSFRNLIAKDICLCPNDSIILKIILVLLTKVVTLYMQVIIVQIRVSKFKKHVNIVSSLN